MKDGAKLLTKTHAGLTELLVDFNEVAPHAVKGIKRRFRPIGFQDAEKRSFLLLNGCAKIEGELVPRDAFDRAIEWWAQSKKGLGKEHDHDS